MNRPADLQVGPQTRRVLVTGAARGIGLGVAKLFQSLGDDVLLADGSVDELAQAAVTIGASGHFVYDQGDPASVAALCNWAGSIDVLVNNAGTLLGGDLLDNAEDDIARLIDVDFLGPVLITRRLGEGMVRRRRGVVINVSSQLAFCGAGGRAVYSACKAAISHFTASIAAEWGEAGVRVVAVAPGRIATKMTEEIRQSAPESELLATVPLRRFGQPEDIAEAIAFLASQKASYITGTTLVVDGGYLTL